MKYIEELQNGETFSFKESYWLMTADFKNNGNRLCYNLDTGTSKWFKSNDIVNINPIYYLDAQNNICPIKIYKNDYQNHNIS